MCMGEGHVPELHIHIPPDAQLVVLRVDHDEQVALVGDPDNDIAGQEQGFRTGAHEGEDGWERLIASQLSLLHHCHALCTMKGRENVCSTPFHPDVGGHVVWTPKHGIDAESMGVSCATGAFGKEKVFGNNWECGSSCESREGKLGTGVNLHQMRGSYGCGQIMEANLTWAVAAGAAGAEKVARTAEAKREVAVVGAGVVVMAGRTGTIGATALVDKTGNNDGKGKVAARQVWQGWQAMVMAGGTGMSEVTMGKGEAYGSDGR
ncbi:hypothetical protein F5148DRAFT_1153988 [Russula earlei]|uniref:Uncharacterized protein n=1 Tax=Russula earlei TaxID=71964 RepID=A0ACC0TSH7_9AGAM|nr:hypothetical protein F5148DRAFT_1153988 [Russula earlei]